MLHDHIMVIHHILHIHDVVVEHTDLSFEYCDVGVHLGLRLDEILDNLVIILGEEAIHLVLFNSQSLHILTVVVEAIVDDPLLLVQLIYLIL